MIFHATHLQGAYRIEPECLHDERGFFARSWCQREFAANGVNPHLVQCSISFNHEKGTLRGMHYQVTPFAETKLVRCTMGAIFDVIVDLRPESPTFRQHLGVELTAENHLMIYVPAGFAHGFITLTDNAEVFYQMSEFYNAAAGRGARWNDPAFGIEWPAPVQVISERDANYADFSM